MDTTIGVRREPADESSADPLARIARVGPPSSHPDLGGSAALI